jgi:hypothetical protein
VHGQQKVVAEDEVDLALLHAARVGEREHDDVDDRLSHLDLGALVAFEDVFGHEPVEREEGGDVRHLLR